MADLEQQIKDLPDYEVTRLDPRAVMGIFLSCGAKLLGEVNPQNLEHFNDAQRDALYVIDEVGSSDRTEGRNIRTEVLKTSEQVFQHLGGKKILEIKPPESEKGAYYRWAICTRHTSVSEEKLAA